MKQYENECCDCATPSYPCVGELCPYRKVPHWYCDECGDECQLYDFEGEELCIECIKDRLEKIEGSEDI